MTSRRILAIETTSPQLTLALGKGARRVSSFKGPTAWRHAEAVFDGIQTLLKKKSWNVESLSGVLVTTGPGSFTGIRIGLALARALGQFRKIPVVGVNSLEVLAQPKLVSSGIVLSVIDALREEYFIGAYRSPRIVLEKERRVTTKELSGLVSRLRKKDRNLTIVGAPNPFHQPAKAAYPDASHLLSFADRLELKGAGRFEKVEPFYLREAAAIERKLGQR